MTRLSHAFCILLACGMLCLGVGGGGAPSDLLRAVPVPKADVVHAAARREPHRNGPRSAAAPARVQRRTVAPPRLAVATKNIRASAGFVLVEERYLQHLALLC